MKKYMDKEDILDCLRRLDKLLGYENQVLTLYMCGGAVVCLCYDRDRTTEDIDAIFDLDEDYLQGLIERVAEEKGIQSDWLNNGIEGLVKAIYFNEEILEGYFRNIKIIAPSLDNMLLLKCIAGRERDIKDILRLLTLRDTLTETKFLEFIEDIDTQGMVKENFKYEVINKLKTTQ